MSIQSFNKTSVPLFAGLITASAAATPITTLDFEQFADPNEVSINLGPVVVEDGFTITATGGNNPVFFASGGASPVFPGSTVVGISEIEDVAVLTYDGDAFDLESIDLTTLLANTEVDFTISAITADGDIVVSDVLNAQTDLISFDLGSDFNNVVQVNLQGGVGNNIVFIDNLVINEAATTVPEPSALGVGALGGAVLLSSRTLGRRREETAPVVVHNTP